MIIKPTTQEKIQAILDSRQAVAEYLQSIDKIEAFEGFSSDDICGLIKVCQEAVQSNLQKQCQTAFSGGTLDDQIPFAPEWRA